MATGGTSPKPVEKTKSPASAESTLNAQWLSDISSILNHIFCQAVPHAEAPQNQPYFPYYLYTELGELCP